MTSNKSSAFIPIPDEVYQEIKKSLDRDNFNFGLYFNKWLTVTATEISDKRKAIEYKFQAKSVTENRIKDSEDAYQLDKALRYYKRLRDALSKILENRQKEIEKCCEAFEKIGYSRCSYKAILKTPLIIGLGNSNPVERGFTFHWTMGIPYIPAESVKGVVRLAYLVETARENHDFFKHWAEEDKEYLLCLKNIFGCAGEEVKDEEISSFRGKVVFLDAIPSKVPELIPEITTCHYTDYYGGKRGPTEDQNPNPVPFFAVKPGVEFEFRMLIWKEISDEEKVNLKTAFESALSEHGFGAKTALGHGKFSVE